MLSSLCGLFVLIEGNDDERFFNHVIKPLIQNAYTNIKVVKFANENAKKIKSLLQSARNSGFDILILVDHDEAPCISHVKYKTARRFDLTLNWINKEIMVVKKMIESWYLAGINPMKMKVSNRDKRNISDFLRNIQFNTERVDKNQFNSLIPMGMSRIEFMTEILAHYDVNRAKDRNGSFLYFLRRVEDFVDQ